MSESKNELTVKQVAQKLGYTEEWVRDLISKKQIKARKHKGWKIEPREIQRFLKSRTNL